MSWSTSLQIATFRGVTFDCQRTKDATKRDVAEHEYPYLDGTDTEDLGRKGRRIDLTAVFWGDTYEIQLKAFQAVLDQAGPAELIHPVYGSIPKTQLLDYEVLHDADNPDHCTVELHFLEKSASNPFFVQQLPAQKAAAISSLTGTIRSNGIAALGTALTALKAASGNMQQLNGLRSVMTSTLGAINRQVQGITGTTLDMIQYPQSFASSVINSLSGIADLRSFDVGVITSDWKSLSGQLASVVKLPGNINSGTAVVQSSGGQVAVGAASNNIPAPTTTSGGTTATTQANLDSALATGSASVPVNAPASAVAPVTAFIQLAAAAQLADTASSILQDEADDPTLTPDEIGQIVGDTRTAIQSAIDLHRQVFTLETSRPIAENLKDTALAIQDAAIAVIEQQPQLVQRAVTMPGNLHLTAFRWYGDYTRADELARLNPNITNPNFLQPGTTLNAYAQ
ncbi:DNA circularization protein [Paludibacterium yongneupense]|uniref:DNA circularization protein n=1 Tax=Paludibacterium yongneupense TaxID=400061 RepID=UPI0004185739|nr:DNA circularization N-terminal domain-containing protein [Paludibacterium yongneupense]